MRLKTENTIRVVIAAVAAALILAACGGRQQADDDGVLRIYTSVTQDTVDAVVAGFEAANPDATVEVFRAPTGEVAARIAAELRDDALGGDIFWLTDPLSIQQYERDGLLREWTPDDIDVVPDDFRTGSFFGTRVLNLVIIADRSLMEMPSDWRDLTGIEGDVAIPDPGFAGSPFAALGFFALSSDYGMDFYRDLKDNGGVQVRSPGDVINGVAEGLYVAGVTLDRAGRDAVEAGSPISLVWPASGAISLYSPIAVVDANGTATAEAFVEYVLSKEAQSAIAGTGWEPIREDVDWPHTGAKLTIDWSLAFDRQEELLADYREIFEG
ncbi:MAG: extracellular solute-binding protein [Acidimicrobiia bacterium]